MLEQTIESRPYLRAIVLSVLGVVLVWEVITRSFVAYLATAAPQAALSLAPTNPDVLLNLADKQLVERLEAARRTGTARPSPGLLASSDASRDPNDRTRAWAEVGARARGADQQVGPATAPAGSGSAPPVDPHLAASDDQLRAWTELALINDPLNARALRMLGQLAAVAGDEARTMKFMRAAATRSLHERFPIYLLMLKGIEKKDYAAAIYYADALLRTTPQALADVMPTLVYVAETPVASSELKAVLAKNPPWRAEFFSALPMAASDAHTPLELFLAIKDTLAPPTTADLRPYLNFLLEKKQYELAYFAWLQFLPAEQLRSVGFLYNGSFELTPSGLPFDWVIVSGAGVTTEILNRPDQEGQHALLIRFEQGRVEFHGVTQLLMLAPGAYQFKGRFKGEIVGRRGLKWHIVCAAGAGRLGESAMLIGATPAWRDIEFPFTVPSGNCRTQQLRLDLDARMSSEQLVTGTMWFDELKIGRLAGEPNK